MQVFKMAIVGQLGWGLHLHTQPGDPGTEYRQPFGSQMSQNCANKPLTSLLFHLCENPCVGYSFADEEAKIQGVK